MNKDITGKEPEEVEAEEVFKPDVLVELGLEFIGPKKNILENLHQPFPQPISKSIDSKGN